MADLTLAQRFGANVSFNETTKLMTIDLNNLSSIMIGGVDFGLNVSAMTNANKNAYASRILWALIQLQRVSQNTDNNDNTVGVYVTNQGKRAAIRNSVSQVGYQLVATAYKNDTEGSELDPDAII
ncbi:hypothetical protein [Chroococcidiopsis sp.]|uniref:hypothetical protein n=1 Tax=Chroococcidiopsis sp. TaxID=3088168 RepID=UPI003F40831A